ncbi:MULTISPECIES: YceI family protein [unclassified Stenotrophomonas]|uniref:YceI family protein n=1 Tax=unclassified Stenotrophomonas TaxID=196198 RepID=UPI000D17DB40|nr:MULTISPECIES: YceI family protein [unclassified Stenotrophomonas]PTA70685.1 polyisoprenoid-binding protein [Stenotrophomonas sp. Nf1]PTA81247.1 polyisoprenoid-binding protein [Stenotrophomonas sp. Nf4]
MNKQTLALTLALVSALATAAASAKPVTYTIDPTHTQVDFRWNHLGLSNPAASVDVVSGTLIWDGEDPTMSSVQVSMPVSSIRTRVPVLDSDFQSEKFFNAALHPMITFRSTRLERIGISSSFRIHGDLTLHGITRPVVLDATLNGEAQHPMFKAPAIGFDATATIRRSDYGLSVALPMVSDEVEVRITVEALEARAAAKASPAR